MHQNSFQSIRKKAFRKACSKVYRTQDSVSYRGGELTPEFLRRSGLEPPPLPLLSGATLSSSPTPTPATFRSYCWCVPFFRTSLLLAPLDLSTYGYGVPLRPGPPASLAGGVFYWLCGTDLFAQQGAERLLFRYQGRTSFSPFCHSHGGHHVAEVGACSPPAAPAPSTAADTATPRVAAPPTRRTEVTPHIQHLKPADASLLEELGFQLP